MKPFDLEKALSGAPVITRDGREVTQLTKFDITVGIALVGVLNGGVKRWYGDGRYVSDRDFCIDLFMAPVMGDK